MEKVYVVKEMMMFSTSIKSIHKSRDKAYKSMMKYAEEHVVHCLKRGGQFAIEPDEYDEDTVYVYFKDYTSDLGREIGVDHDQSTYYIQEYEVED